MDEITQEQIDEYLKLYNDPVKLVEELLRVKSLLNAKEIELSQIKFLLKGSTETVDRLKERLYRISGIALEPLNLVARSFHE